MLWTEVSNFTDAHKKGEMMDKILIDEIFVAHKRSEDCPLVKEGFCSVTSLECRYGLTDVRVPKECPLKIKSIKITRRRRLVDTDF